MKHRIVGFSKYSNSANASFSVFHNVFSQIANPKSSHDPIPNQMSYNYYSNFWSMFKVSNFTNLSNPQNLSTLKKPTIQYTEDRGEICNI